MRVSNPVTPSSSSAIRNPPSRTLILSDTHFARESCKHVTPQALRPLWLETHDGKPIDHLIINGDVAEIQMPHIRTQAARMIDELQQLAADDGIQLTLISGNHDAFLTDHRYATLANDRIFITHGDVFHPAICTWVPEAKELKQLTRQAMEKLPNPYQPTLNERLEIAQHVSHAEFIEYLHGRPDHSHLPLLLSPYRIGQVLYYWKQVPTWAAQFARRYAPQARFVIFGHSHHAGRWKRGQQMVLNTGAYSFPGQPHSVLVDEAQNTIALHRLGYVNNHFYTRRKLWASPIH